MSFSSSTLSQPPKPFASSAFAKFTLAGLFLLTAGVWFGSRTLLSTNFLPHWYCLVGNKRLLWTTVLSDLLIGISYVVISATLVWLVRRCGREIPYNGFFWAFGLFIVSCGVTHFFEVLTVWKPVYWMSAAAKVVTAVASVGTAVVLLVVADEIVGFVSTAQKAMVGRGNEQFRALFQAAPMAVVSCDRKGLVVAWNPTAERIFGWKAEEVIGSPSPAIPSDKWSEFDDLLSRNAAGNMTHNLETVRVDRNKHRFPVNISAAPVYDERGKLVAIMETIEDISERKQIASELQEKTAVLTTVTQALNTYLDLGDWSAASQHLLQFAIRQTASEYGFLGVLLEGSVLRVLAHEGVMWDANLNRELYEEKMRQKTRDGYFEIAHHHNFLGEVISKKETIISNATASDSRSGGVPAGHPQMHSFLGVPIFKSSTIVGLIAVANRPGGYTNQEVQYLEMMSETTGILYESYRQNIYHQALEEEQVRLETQMRQAQKMEVLGRLAGGVAHDFNNLLMVLDSSSELLDRSLPAESHARTYLDQIRATTERAASVTNQLLAFSRKQVIEFRPIDLHEALTSCEYMLPRLLGSDIELTVRHEAPHSWIYCDPSQVSQIVANLVINARDAMPKGGQLTILTRGEAHLPDQNGDAPSSENRWIVLEVTDTGSGMDEATRARIFEPFFTTKPQGKGTGLGLSTVYGIVRQCGGQIYVDTAPGKGTRFKIYFATTESQPKISVPSQGRSVTGNVGEGITVLLADDEAGLRQSLAEMLRMSGYCVLEARTAPEAVEFAKEHQGDLTFLLTDIVMPGMRGPELAQKVKALHPETHVIYMSGYADGFTENNNALDSTFLQKPFRFATLLDRLKVAREKSRSSSAS